MAKKWSKEARERASARMKGQLASDLAERSEKEQKYRYNMEVIDRSEEPIIVSEDQKYFVKRNFGYVDDIQFELGEIVNLRGLPNDKKLIGLGYVVPCEIKEEYRNSCLKCGKQFGNTASYNVHVATHYDMCAVCNRGIPPENMTRHLEAHSELAV